MHSSLASSPWLVLGQCLLLLADALTHQAIINQKLLAASSACPWTPVKFTLTTHGFAGEVQASAVQLVLVLGLGTTPCPCTSWPGLGRSDTTR